MSMLTSADLLGDSAIVAIVITAKVRMLANEEMVVPLSLASSLLLSILECTIDLFLINFDSAALCFPQQSQSQALVLFCFFLPLSQKDDFI